MIDYKEMLKENPGGVLATRNGDKVDTRMLHCIFCDANRAYFCTSADKPVCAQLMDNPNASFCTFPQNYTPVLTLNGRVTFVEDRAFKARVMEESAMVKGHYQTPDNPVYKLFCLEVEEVKTYYPGTGTEREGL